MTCECFRGKYSACADLQFMTWPENENIFFFFIVPRFQEKNRLTIYF